MSSFVNNGSTVLVVTSHAQVRDSAVIVGAEQYRAVVPARQQRVVGPFDVEKFGTVVEFRIGRDLGVNVVDLAAPST